MTGRSAEGLHDFQTALDLGRETDPVVYAIAVSNKTELVDLGFDLVDGRLVDETRKRCAGRRRSATATDSHWRAWRTERPSSRAVTRDRDAGIELLELSRSGGIDIGGSVTEAELATAIGWQDRRDDQIDLL